MKEKRTSSEEEFWYEQTIRLPIECERQFFLNESESTKGYRAIDFQGHKEIEFELVEVGSKWQRN